MTVDTVPVSVVVPTIGRVERLRACLWSLDRCRPGAAEVLVVDQSWTAAVSDIVDSLGRDEFHVIPCEARGVAHGTNLGLRRAHHDIVLVTHDDCTVDASWIGKAWSLMDEKPHRIVT